jgi:hypothetical protein
VDAYVAIRRLLLVSNPHVSIYWGSAASIVLLIGVLAAIVLTTLLLTIGRGDYADPRVMTYAGSIGLVHAFLWLYNLSSRQIVGAFTNNYAANDSAMIAEYANASYRLLAINNENPHSATGLEPQREQQRDLTRRLGWARQTILDDGEKYCQRAVLVKMTFSGVVQLALAAATLISVCLRLVTA